MDLASSSPTKENESLIDADTKSATTSPVRSSTLSWQRRPNSRAAARPLSMLATQNATQRSLVGSQDPAPAPAPAPASATEQTFSKDQIAQALGSKDPAWFRQTADRGANSAAYRRNQVEDEDRMDLASLKAQLPGMAADKPQVSPPLEQATTPGRMRLASPPTLNPPQFDNKSDENLATDRSLNASPAGRVSPTRSNSRSNSPTKGMGGFVQSAMMKRSDSVKRWSVAGPPGLSRADSVTSSRSTGLGSNRPQSMARPGSTTPSSSRPTSRHGEKESEEEATPKAPTIDTTLESRTPKAEPVERIHIPTSPSKTMDPRRWSPTKSSWLESALNKPESPKPRHKPTSSQPSWMAELNKNKADKTGDSNTETTRPRPGSISHRHQVSIGGLMRSTPMGATGTNPTGLGGIYSPPPGGNRPAQGHGASLSISKSAPKLEPAESEEEMPDPAPELKKFPEPEPEKPEEKPLDVEEEKPTRSPVESKPPAPKPKSKPETPPKDFRSGLRSRPTGSDAPKTEEPEFKNVFGTLRRARTQNYVAPDELKSNILRGKASLNQTGGPQKSERVDEFKEAILKKKDGFKKVQSEGKGVTRSNTVSANKSLPEGLAKRAELGMRRDTIESKPSKPDSPKPTPGPKRIPSQPLSSPKPVAAASVLDPEIDSLKRVSTESSKPSTEPRPLPGLHKETSAPSRLQGRVGGKLAERFNPALVGMLARGPPPMAANGGQDAGKSDAKSVVNDDSEPSAPGPQLTHMTKGRARGPKRKAPTSGAAPATSTPKASASLAIKPRPLLEKQPEPAPRELADSVKGTPTEEKPAGEDHATVPAQSIQQQVAAKASPRSKPSPFQQTEKNNNEPQSSEPRGSLFLRKQKTNVEPSVGDFPSPLRIQKTGGDATQPGSPKKLDTNRISKFFDDTTPKDSRPEQTREPAKLTHQRTGSRSPVKMFQRPLPEPEPSSPTKVGSDPVISTKNAAAIFGGGSDAAASARSPPPLAAKPSFGSPASELAVAKTPSRVTARPLPEPEASSPEVARTPLRTATRPLPTLPSREPQTPQKAPSALVASPKPKAGNDVASLLNEFFGTQQPRTAYNVDAAELLTQKPATGPARIQSLSFQVFQISAEGKKTPVSYQHERVLFEGEMYIAPHSFTNEAGWKRLEIYFWVGDRVPEAAADDAFVFVQKEAKHLGGKLVKMQQGKESTEFLHALGGVVMTRRGSSHKYDSLAPNLFCGRQYQGQVVFDEMDYTPASLCAGFPYLITNQGKCYIWKGRGSDATELSAARLLSMDLTLTGDLTEYNDGEESADFWNLFEGGSKPHSADHWRLKPNYAKYCSRLFCSDADKRQQVCLLFMTNSHKMVLTCAQDL